MKIVWKSALKQDIKSHFDDVIRDLEFHDKKFEIDDLKNLSEELSNKIIAGERLIPSVV